MTIGQNSRMSFSLPTQLKNREGGQGPLPGNALPGFTVRLRPAVVTPRRGSGWKQFFIVTLLLLFSATSYLAVSRYIVTAVVIQGRSMSPTLKDGEHCFLDRWTLNHREPARGDLVVIRDPGHDDYAVKRIVAMPGETVSIKDGRVYIDDACLPEPYLDRDVRTYTPGNQDQWIMLGQSHYFVLGDNRPVSEDSRCYGPLRRDAIVGLISH